MNSTLTHNSRLSDLIAELQRAEDLGAKSFVIATDVLKSIFANNAAPFRAGALHVELDSVIRGKSMGYGIGTHVTTITMNVLLDEGHAPRLVALIKASVKLAIIRHGLVQEDGDESDDFIATDTANAMQGIDTCEEQPCEEWLALIRKGKR